MNAAYPADSLVRRNLLAYTIATRAVVEWDQVKERIPAAQRELPHVLLGVCQRALRGEITERQEAREVDVNQVEATMELLAKYKAWPEWLTAKSTRGLSG